VSTFYLDFENGNDANDGTTYANRWKTMFNGATAARINAGDTVRLQASRTGILAGCSITNGSNLLTVPSGNHKVLCNCETTTGWTFSSGLTGSVLTQRLQGNNSIGITGSTFSTGKMASFNIGSALNLSSYSAIAFVFRIGVSATINITIRLCSDTAGNTTVNSFTFKKWVYGGAGCYPIMLMNGGSLGSSIQSIAIDTNSALGTQTLQFDAIAACQDPSVNPNAITPMSVCAQTNNINNLFTWNYNDGLVQFNAFNDDTTILLAQNQGASTNAGTNVTYPFPTLSNGTLYIWHGMNYGIDSTSVSTAKDQFTKAGTSSSAKISYSGGWDRTNMSTSGGLTVLFHQNCGTHLSGNFAYTGLTNVVFIAGNNIGQYPTYMNNIGVATNQGGGTSNTAGVQATNFYYSLGGASNTSLTLGNNTTYNGVKVCNANPSNYIITFNNLQYGGRIENMCFRNSTKCFSMSGVGETTYCLRNMLTNLGTGNSLFTTSAPVNRFYVKNWDLSQETSASPVNNWPVYSHNHNLISGNFAGWLQNFTITKDTVVFDSGLASLKFTQTSGGPGDVTIPTQVYKIADLKPSGLSTQTLTLRVNRSNTALIVGLVIYPGVTVSSQIASYTSGSAGAWETVTLSWTPTTVDSEEIFVVFYGTSSLYTANIDNLKLNGNLITDFETYELGMPVVAGGTSTPTLLAYGN
jgi:hypothetical protein